MPSGVGESSQADSGPTDASQASAETSDDPSETGEAASSSTITAASDTQAETDIQLEDEIHPEEARSETDAESAEVSNDTEPSDPSAESGSEPTAGIEAGVTNTEDATLEDSSDEALAETINPSEDEDVSSSNPSGPLEATSDGVVAEEVGDRAWRLVQNRGRLRVGIDPTIGYAYLRANPERRTFEGFEWDILQAIAKELNVDIEPIYIPWSNQLAALDSNSVDVILGGRDELGVDETRFIPTLPYYSSPQRIVVREELSGEIQHLSDLFGQKVGTVADSAGAAVVEVFNQERANALTLLSSPNPSRLFEQLRQSEVDAIVIDQPVAVAEAELVEAIAPEAGDRVSDDEGSSSASANAAEDSSPDASTPGASTSGANSGHTLDTDPDLDVTESIKIEPVVSSNPRPVEVADEVTGSSDAIREEEPAGEESVNENTTTEDTASDVNLNIVGEPMFPTPLVGVVKAENASIKQAIDEAIATLEQNGTLTTILENWEL